MMRCSCNSGSKGAVNSVDEIKELAEEIGYPVVLKAKSGGGGKGIRIVKGQNNLKNPLKKRKAKVKNTLTMTEFMLKHLYQRNTWKYKLLVTVKVIMYI